jgi:hypothetical protein
VTGVDLAAADQEGAGKLAMHYRYHKFERLCWLTMRHWESLDTWDVPEHVTLSFGAV